MVDGSTTGAAPSTGPSPTEASKPRPKPLGPGCLLVAFAAAGLGALGIHLALRPSGDPMGDVDLLDPKSTVALDGHTGDSLTFVGTYTTGLGAYSGSSKNKSNAAVEAMKTSTLTVVVTAPDGREDTASCPLWGGSTSTDRDDDFSTENGVINDCEIRLAAEGKHTVSASVRWTHGLAMGGAKVTVYNDRP